jgi:alpha-glucosidase (family GH31 glycosyl hydrolase)
MGITTKPEEELYIRWLQFSMFNPITEVFSQPENPTANMAWLYSVRADSIFRYYAQWRMRLFPYIYSYALRSRVEGKHMLGKFPESIYQYTFGDEMLLAPVYEKSAETQIILLPEGKWMNHWTGEIYEGKQTITVAAPLEQIPLFVKLGSIIPMRNYASSVEKGNNDTLMLHIYPGDRGSFNLLEDDGTSNDYLEGLYAATMIETKSEKNAVIVKINPLQGSYKGIKKTRKWNILIHSRQEPSTILVNNQKCEFKYNPKEKLITIENSPLPVGMSSTFKVKFQE